MVFINDFGSNYYHLLAAFVLHPLQMFFDLFLREDSDAWVVDHALLPL